MTKQTQDPIEPELFNLLQVQEQANIVLDNFLKTMPEIWVKNDDGSNMNQEQAHHHISQSFAGYLEATFEEHAQLELELPYLSVGSRINIYSKEHKRYVCINSTSEAIFIDAVDLESKYLLEAIVEPDEEELDEDTFVCGKCKQPTDIEESVRPERNAELICEDCAN